ncbi:MAG TPA: hypothetical protein VJJ51_10240, partial [Candidatus Methanoperedens sp.]|nr:hypothetical protein [Candidatus Methanoperedens sp.]
MDIKDFEKILKYVLTGLLLFGIAAGNANAFNFQGYALDTNKSPLNNTSVIIEESGFVAGSPPQIISTRSNSSNESGYFKVTNIP